MRQRRRSQDSQRGLSAGSCSLLALIILIGIPPLARATTVIKMSLETVVAEADRIAVCEVIDMTTIFDAKTRNPITRVTFQPAEWWKGETEERTVDLEFLGGPVGDGTILIVAGMPRFLVGERYVLFWVDGNHWVNPIVGWNQGQYRVVKGPNGELLVEIPETPPHDEDVNLAAELAARPTIPALHQRRPTRMPLESLHTRVTKITNAR